MRLAAVAVVALVLSACGASQPPASSARGKLLAFSRCMRAHGVASFPDPQPGAANAKVPSAQSLGVAGPQLDAAERACGRQLAPGVDDVFPPAEVQLLLVGMRRFSGCMRSRGVAGWPDPTIDADGRPLFRLSAHGFSRQQAHSPQIARVIAACQRLLPGALGGVPTG